MEDNLLYRDECYQIQGAVFEVSRVMGAGFSETVFQECLDLESKERGIPFRAQPELTLHDNHHVLKQHYRPDFICYDKIILDLKALSDLTGDHRAQVPNYLRSTKLKLGLLVNSGKPPTAIVERFVF